MEFKKNRVLYSFLTLLSILVLTAWVRMPIPAQIRRAALGSDRVLLAANGQVLQTLRTDYSKRRLAWFPISSFPQTVRDAVVQTEDHRFRSHFGFDPLGFLRAARAILLRRPIQGASTITMQLTDLIQDDVLLKNRQIKKGSLLHKFVQLGRAVLLETKWSKDEILEAYLNLIHLRGEFQGVPALSFAFLGKHPLALDRPEAEVIAAMIASPNQSARALKSKACMLFKHQIGGDCAGVDAAVDAFFHGAPSMPASPGYAPHLARRLFNEQTKEPIVKATIDFDLQVKVAEILEKNLYRLKEANVRDSAAIVIDNRTGQVLAYVGAVAGSESPHVDGIQAYRQAGSTLKPFLYAQAFASKTLTPASILLDEPTAISWSGGVYRPANYDRHFSGPVSAREALGSSLNVPAVKTVTILGLHQAYQVLQAIHLSALKEPDFYGVSLALGAVEVRLEDLANAYRIFANRGLWSPLSFIPNATPAKGERVFSEPASFLISSILSDSAARAIGFGWDTPLETPFWTAVKTGTSKDYRDNWCAGFSERYTVAVWAGNFNAEAMQKVSGVSGAGPSWYDIMTYLHRRERSTAPTLPSGVVAKKLRHQWASHEHLEYFIAGTEPAQSVIETAPEKRAQFVFPAEGSVLVKDPHLAPEHVALFVRFKGQVPDNSRLLWDGQALGVAASPFKLDHPATGAHQLSIVSPEGKIVSAVHFEIRGIN